MLLSFYFSGAVFEFFGLSVAFCWLEFVDSTTACVYV